MANEKISRVSTSIFTCHCCNSPLNYVQILNDELRIQEDFFECQNCGTRIDSLMTEDEDVPAFFD
ncbi:hypothetical protein [Arcticibacter eurypsychrophilus]|uniref:hypothetical protein n=1 Tax=Arcticibacter eurypsychrophilus TaxID=1434752 RepID=UPI001038B2CD|nr:hypothetical protein [Arcticibacter eurypsychrophilus]